MKRRLLSLFLAFVTILSLLPTAAFAASSEEDALGEVDIYNGDYELGYLAINGAVKKQKYTYFLYESNDGSTKESPAYCVNPNQYGVPQTVGPGESIKYLANEKASDPKVVGIISNGYPRRSLGELGPVSYTHLICTLCVGQASALEYTMDAPEDHLFGRPTSDDTIYEWEDPNVDQMCIRDSPSPRRTAGPGSPGPRRCLPRRAAP